MSNKRKFKFQKLVRDKLKPLMEEKGSIIHSRILNEDEYIKALEEKLMEEVEEMLATDNEETLLLAEEIADVYEVLECMIEALGLSKDDIETAKVKKIEKRGSFKKRIYFDTVEVDEEDEDCRYLLKNPDRYPEL